MPTCSSTPGSSATQATPSGSTNWTHATDLAVRNYPSFWARIHPSCAARSDFCATGVIGIGVLGIGRYVNRRLAAQ